VLAFGQLA